MVFRGVIVCVFVFVVDGRWYNFSGDFYPPQKLAWKIGWRSYERKQIYNGTNPQRKHYAKRKMKTEFCSGGKGKKKREKERKFELVWNFFWFRRLPVVMCSILKTTYLDICVFFVWIVDFLNKFDRFKRCSDEKHEREFRYFVSNV